MLLQILWKRARLALGREDPPGKTGTEAEEMLAWWNAEDTLPESGRRTQTT